MGNSPSNTCRVVFVKTGTHVAGTAEYRVPAHDIIGDQCLDSGPVAACDARTQHFLIEPDSGEFHIPGVVMIAQQGGQANGLILVGKIFGMLER